MSEILHQTLSQGRRLVLLGAAVVFVVAITLIVWARGGDTASSPEPSPVRDSHTLETDAPVNPWAANDCAVLLDVFGDDAHAWGC